MLRSINMLSAAVCVLLACDDALAPNTSGVRATVAAIQELPVTYICDNRFRFKNLSDSATVFEWEISGTGERGRVNLAGRKDVAASEVRIVTSKSGPIRVMAAGRLVATVANKGVSCLSIAPSVTPRPVWDSVSATENVLVGARGITGRVIRHTLYVRFRPGTRLTQKEAALAAIDAEVIGGVPIGPPGEGYYHLRLRLPKVAEKDSAASLLLRARRILRSLPFVAGVVLDRLDGVSPSFVKPSDGTGFQSWRLSPDSATGANWRLDAIESTLGWSCETGNTSVNVAVVDQGFYSNPDLQGNIGTVQDLAPPNDTAPEHGTMVASIIGARGNNGIGISGVMWRAALNLYDSRQPDTLAQNPTWRPIVRMLRAGETHKIVNVSMGLFWLQQRGRLPDSTNQADIEAVDDIKGLVETAIAQAPNALYVISASNDYVDAYWSGYAAAAADPNIRDRVIVVSGTQLTTAQPRQELWLETSNYGQTNHPAGANTGNLVDVVAPAGSITTLDRTGALAVASGNSFAAPHVSGLAGLLLSMDPSLSAAELKTLIVQGAVDGGRFVPDPRVSGRNIPVINLHESLARSARKPGLPLCANRVWRAGDNILAQRGAVTEVLANVSGTPTLTSTVHVRHGGRVINAFYDQQVPLQFNYQQASPHWVPATFEGETWLSDSSWNGTFTTNTYWTADHDEHNYYKAFGSWNEDSTAQHIVVRRRDGASWIEVDSAWLDISKQKPASVCERRDVEEPLECDQWGPDGVWEELQPFVANRLPFAVSARDSLVVWVAVNWGYYNVQHGPWQLCPGEEFVECRAVTWHDSSSRVEVYRANIRNNSWVLEPLTSSGGTAIHGRQFTFMAVAESGKEIIAQQRLRRVIGGVPQLCTNQSIVYLNRSSGAENLSIAVPDDSMCLVSFLDRSDWFFGDGTMAPGIRQNEPVPAAARAADRTPGVLRRRLNPRP